MTLLDQLQSELGPAYKLDRELTGGGMSQVFVATEVALGRSVVIKVLRPDLAAEVMTERFTREIQVIARLQQANIVPLISAGTTVSGPFYTMPFVDGASLRQRIAEHGPLELGEVVGILRDIARALAYAHDAGVIHRDIKPENVLLSGGAAVVTDFGIAKAVSAARGEPGIATTITQVGMGVGTPAYMAPEQAAGDPAIDHRADIYAFGCVAYELLAGHPPFHGMPPHRLLAAQIADVPPPLPAMVGAGPAGLKALVERCLEKNPERRPQSARALLDALASLDALSAPALRIEDPAQKRKRSRTGLVLGASTVAAVLVLAVRFAINRTAASDGVDPAVAVIPFVNVGGDSAQDYLADGVSDELATEIGKLPGVHLTARSAAYRFRGQRGLDVRSLGKTLQARFVLQGTLRKSGDELRVTANLSDATTGRELWSDNFNRTNGDVFRTQDDITAAIAKALASRLKQGTIAAQATPGANARGTSDAAAYDDYLRGEFLLRHRQIEPAISSYQAAIARDSSFGRAFAGLADALALTTYYSAAPPAAVNVRVFAAASTALRLDPGLASAHMAVGLARMHAWEWPGARVAFDSAVAVDPNDLESRVQFGRFLYFTGDDAGATEQWQHAQQIDPFGAIAAAWMALLLSEKGNLREAASQIQRASEYDSTAGVVIDLGARVQIRLGADTKARDLAKRMPLAPPFGGERAYVLAQTGDTAGAREVIRELERRRPPLGFLNNALGMAYIGIGDTARALTALERATDAHEAWPLFQRVGDPLWDPLRKSARWASLMRRVGLQAIPHALP